VFPSGEALSAGRGAFGAAGLAREALSAGRGRRGGVFAPKAARGQRAGGSRAAGSRAAASRRMSREIIVLPGGGYSRLAPYEGEPVAEWLRGLGWDARVVEYPVGTRHPGPLNVVAREIAASRAAGATQVGVIGFSAGGHLAGHAALALTGAGAGRGARCRLSAWLRPPPHPSSFGRRRMTHPCPSRSTATLSARRWGQRNWLNDSALPVGPPTRSVSSAAITVSAEV